MNIVVDNLLVQYERSGTGPSVVLVHGWGDSLATFRELQQFLSENYEVISFDLPGFGQTQSPNGVWGLDDYARFVEHFLDKLDVSDVYALIGHSNGGAIVIRGLGTTMLKSQKCILLASSGIRSEFKGKKKVLRLAAKAGKAMTAPLPRVVKNRIKKRAYSAIGSDLFVAEHLQETFKRVVTDDVLDNAKHIMQPTLLIYGKDDTATPPRYGTLLNGVIKYSKLIIIDLAGHFVHHDQPERVRVCIEEFLG